MESEPLAAADGRKLNPTALLSLRLAATGLLLAGNAWVVLNYFEFWHKWGEVLRMVMGGPLDLSLETRLALQCGVWPVVLTTAGVIAAIIYIWGFARSVLSVLMATAYAGAFCGIVGGLFRLAAVNPRHFW